MNYHLFFPIQIYRHSEKKLFRIESPSLTLSTPQEYIFHPHFIHSVKNISNHDRIKLEKLWIYENTLWGINPKYSLYLSRMMNVLLIHQNMSPPYETDFLRIVQTNISSELISESSFMFGYFIYPVPDTSLLYLSTDEDTDELLDIVLVKERRTFRNHNFLPVQQYKNTPFYDIFFYHSHIFCYIYEKPPAQLFWKTTDTNICIPSDNPDDYPTIIDCINDNIDKMNNRSVYLHDPLAPLTRYFSEKNRPPRTLIIFGYILSILILLSLSILIFLKK